jgi:TPR repeat protein
MRGRPNTEDFEGRVRAFALALLSAGLLGGAFGPVPARADRDLGDMPRRTPREALLAVSRDCGAGDAMACVTLVDQSSSRLARRAGLDMQPAAAEALLERICFTGHAPACDRRAARAELAYARDRSHDPAADTRARWYSLGCDFGSQSACFVLGRAFARGEPLADHAYFERDGTGPDLARAAGYYEEACALGAPNACGAAMDAFAENDDPCGAARVAQRLCRASSRNRRCRAEAELIASCRARTSIALPDPEPAGSPEPE